MKLEEGKYYRGVDGKKYGPMEKATHATFHPWQEAKANSTHIWNDDGSSDWENDPDLVAEWKDTEEMTKDTPKMWKDMTDEEKGALLLAHHKGKTIEFWCVDEWMSLDNGPSWLPYHAYRVKPAPKEPKRKTVTIFGMVDYDYCGEPCFFNYPEKDQNLKITFDLIDGVPDCDSIKMEEL